ncbi:MAG: hypothetical protein ACOC01_02520 [Bacteroidales bacterium]
MKAFIQASVTLVLVLQATAGLSQDFSVAAKSSADSITIGDQFNYTLSLPAESDDTVVFPEFSEDTIISELEIIERHNAKFDEDKQLISRSYTVAAYEHGGKSIPSQEIVMNPGSDSLLLESNSLSVYIEPVVVVDTLKVDTIYAERGGIVVFGKSGFKQEIEQQITDSVRRSMSPDSVQMLEDTLRQMLTQRFASEIFRNVGFRKETEIAQIAGASTERIFILKPQAVQNNYRIPGARDTVFVQEFDTVTTGQALYTAYEIKDIEDDLYKTPLTVSEALYYFLAFLKKNWWWLTVLVLLILGAIYYFRFYKKNKPVFRQIVKPSEPAHVIAFRELDRIKSEKLWLKNRVKDFYTDLTDTLRHYLENRYDVKAMEKTSAEIMELLDKEDLLEDRLREKMRDILQRSDFVKFAKSQPLTNENEMSLTQAYEIVEESKEVRTDKSELVDAELQTENEDTDEPTSQKQKGS